MAESMTFTLRGRDDLSRVLNRAGDSASDLRRELDSVSGATRDTGGRLRDANGRFVALGSAASSAAGSVASFGSAIGTRSGGAGAGVMAFAAAVGVSALPAIGALVPMMVGAGAAAGVAALAFNGVGEALGHAGNDAEAYKEALAKMSAPQREFTKELAKVKAEFKDFGKEIQGILLPKFTQAIRDAAPLLDPLQDGLRETAEEFSRFGDVFGELFGSQRFRHALRSNLSMGAKFIGDLAQPLADFTQAFLDFGEASQPTLKAFSDGIGGLLGKGIPGFFQGLERGVSGSAKMFDGLFDAVNKILPAFGDLVGAITEAVGPALGQIFRAQGDTAAMMMRDLADAAVFLKPVFMEVAGAVRVVSDVMGIVAGVSRRVAGVLLETFWPSFREAKNAVGPMQRLADWFDKNEKVIGDFVIVAANGIIDFVSTVIGAIPGAIRMFRFMATVVLAAFDAIISGAAELFGWIPGIGEKLTDANKSFDKFKSGVLTSLDDAAAGAQRFADNVRPKLEENKLKMNIRDWQSKIKTAEKQLVNAKGEKKAKLTADIKDWKAKVAAAEKQLRTAKDSKTATLRGNIKDWSQKIRTAERELRNAPSSKTAKLRGEISDLRSKIAEARRILNAFDGSSATSYIYTVYKSNKQSFDLNHGPRRAQGGPIRGYATGGQVQGYPGGGAVMGPGTSTSDSIPAMLSDGEFVIRAAMVRRYGESFFSMLNQGSLPLDRPTAGSSGLFERGGRNVGREVADGLRDALPVVRDAGKRLGQEFAGNASRKPSGYARAVAELNRLVDSGRWDNKGSRLFEDISFQGMSKNFGRHQDKVADGFWAAVREIQSAVRSGKMVHEDMSFKGMSKNANRFHDAIAQIWKGNPYGDNFGDWGRFGKYQQYGTPRMANSTRGTATSAPASSTTVNVYPQRANFTTHDLESLQNRLDTRARIGRPR